MSSPTGQSRTYPTYQSGSGWNAMLPPRAARSAAPPERRVKYLVVGAGYTGLAAARRIAELRPQDRVLVVDATVAGEGSAGRNSGFLINLPHNTRMSGHHSPLQVARKQIAMFQAGLDWLAQLSQQGGFDCGWDVAGKYHAAATPGGERNLRAALAQYRDWGVDYTELDRDALRAALGTGYYRFGYHSMNNVFVQPAALIRGLADTLPENVWLMEDNPVLSIAGAGPYRVGTRAGEYVADNVILANNAFARRLGFLRSRLITIYTYAGVTPVLDPARQAQLGERDQWGVIPANRLGTTLRRIRGGRFMVRSAYSYEAEQPMPRVAQMLRAAFERRYPDLGAYDFEYVWSGSTALTRNGASFVGQVRPGLYASVGCNGAGVIKGTIYGKLLGELVAGQRSAMLDDLAAFEKPNWLPPDPLRRLGVLGAIALQARKAGLER
ncbi:NAD(P)/FAD-dependent oxidoreductase [Bordetella petrii]|uniref:FAD-binding oxidoreductase n=1 Tax=Bordetella petrii TaxID=94624 RepID=A0ABT7W6X6_9BORD|nr:FAD-binding oxidoreductase [Bordetella petrii]MDM9560953.1 FAD-binding oxidoreductase [Bordetella petrii]